MNNKQTDLSGDGKFAAFESLSTSLENLVTSCWSCNYGKLDATLEQIGISNPLERGINKIDDWDGLSTDL
jgi:hypothetical protein